MKVRRHIRLLVLVTIAWALFWLLGLPDYYQQYTDIINVGVRSEYFDSDCSLYCLDIKEDSEKISNIHVTLAGILYNSAIVYL